MSDGSFIDKNFVIVTTDHSLVTKEMNFLETIFFNVLQTVGLIPTSGENVERDLATNGERQTVVWEFLFQSFNELSSDLVFLIVSF